MEWQDLLSDLRVRDVVSGSTRSAQPAGDLRTQFERDYGRTVFSTPIRRLQDKAQVFPMDPNDAVRTRLTHSMEVSALCESLASQAVAWMRPAGHIDESQGASIKAIAKTAGLLHDIGNPPFGHSGEDAIREWFSKKFRSDPGLTEGWPIQWIKDFTSFEGNAQTIRLITHLQMLNDPHGLNLTCGTISACCKYVASSDRMNSANQAWKKVGYFASEAEQIERVRSETKTGELRNPITYLVEAADDMVYSTVDLEDGVRKGVIGWDELREEILARVHGDVAITALFDRCEQYIAKGEFPLSGRALDEARVQIFRTFAIYEHVEAVSKEFRASYKEIMDGSYAHELITQGASSALLKASKKLGQARIYNSKETLRLELFGRRVIQELLTLFWEGAAEAPSSDPKWIATFPGKAFELFSTNYKTLFQFNLSRSPSDPKLKLALNYWRLRLVADYIAGMTDSYATSLYGELAIGS
jgi:dGTPase